jgi:hypothetical protein
LAIVYAGGQSADGIILQLHLYVVAQGVFGKLAKAVLCAKIPNLFIIVSARHAGGVAVVVVNIVYAKVIGVGILLLVNRFCLVKNEKKSL